MRVFLATSLLVFLGACARPPAPNTDSLPLDLPEAYVARNDVIGDPASSGDRWWTSFGVPELDSVVTEAMRANPTLDLALANVQAARASARIQGADRRPQLNASGRANRSEQIFVGLPIPGRDVLSSLSTSYALSLDASWEVDLWNRLGARQRAAVAELQATEAELAGARLSVTALAARNFVELTELELQRDLAARTFEAYRTTGRLAEDRYARGLTNALDVHLTRTSTENAAALLALRETQVQQTRRRLETVLGRYPRGEVRGAAQIGETLPAVPAGMPVELLLRRPDLVAAERRVIAAHARTSEARRNLLPRLALTGSTGTTSRELGDLLDGDFSVWSIAGSLLQPLFQGGRLRAQVELQRAGADAALAAFVQSALNAFSEVESALAAESLLTEREHHLAAASEHAARAWHLSEDRYRQGIGDLLGVLEAQRRALAADSEHIAVRSARWQNRIALHLALGGGFAADAPHGSHTPDSPTTE